MSDEFKFVIKKPRLQIDSDKMEYRMMIYAKYDHHVYHFDVDQNLPTPSYEQIRLGVLELKQNLIKQILSAEFEVEKDE